jgi:DNA-binding transcriptional MerR regulator
MAKRALDHEAFPYKMKDLSELTGLPRQAVHFYIAQGLVPEGHKTGRNMAWYGERHVERIRLIRKLQEEQFLPLRAIKAILEERDESFTPAQRQLLSAVKDRLHETLGRDGARGELVEVRPLLERAHVDRADFEEMVESGLLATTRGRRGKMLIAKEDAWLVELWGRVRAAGFTRELGFAPKLLTLFETAIAQVFQKEVELFSGRLAHLSPDEVATLLSRAMPIIGELLVRLHENKVRTFLGAAV